VEDRRGGGHVGRHRPLVLARGVGGFGVLPAIAVLAVADLALLRVDRGALDSRAAAGRQSLAVPRNADVPKRAVSLTERLSKTGRPDHGRAHAQGKGKAGRYEEAITRRHVSPRPCCRFPNW